MKFLTIPTIGAKLIKTKKFKEQIFMDKLTKSKQRVVMLVCACLMILTGASDALRGVFLPSFQSHFELTKFQQSLIISISYVGNLIFLFVGGFFADRMSKKKFLCINMILWLLALGVYTVVNDYYVLLCCMIVSMGASTMLSTTVNLITPLVFMSPALYVNVFNFTQGVGISTAQNVGGKFADSFGNFHIANLILLSLGVICLLLVIAFVKIPNDKVENPTEKSGYNDGASPLLKIVLKNPACVFLILMFGLYNVSEHGLMNWLTDYGSKHLGFSVPKASTYLSLFFIGITLGRLAFAPLVQKIGVMKSMLAFSTTAGILYIVGLMTGRQGIVLVCVSGLAFSIIYPTMVLMIQSYYPASVSGTATGFIIGISNLFDITFNAFFGKAVEKFGFGLSIKILPLTMLLFVISLYLLKIFVKEKSCD